MKRVTVNPRPNWQARLEEAGCEYHTIDGQAYWNETAAYEFTEAEIDRIEAVTNELHAMCIDHCTTTVERGDYEGYEFPAEVKEIVERSWNEDAEEGSHLFGRFDFGIEGDCEKIKLYEYNADTPTSLLEASILQWHAMGDRGWPDQFNSIHETLIQRWKKVLNYSNRYSHVHFTAAKEGRHEDWGNLHYMLEVAAEAGAGRTSSLSFDQIGISTESWHFIDLNNQEIHLLFKLYPWEWILREEYGWKVKHTKTRFIEPAWKLLLSTKALLPRLWKVHRGHPNLLASYFEGEVGATPTTAYVRKPLLGREGANISIVGPGHQKVVITPDPLYDRHGYIVQERFITDPYPAALKGDSVVYPVIGSWVVGNTACGMGIREDVSAVTTNNSMFVPHYFT